ncbi:MAG: M48 family metallopeptidase [Deltaproteobacteria bacterium]|nr:M48 family metallopeptidase [Deltaproteobacteria bacterium]
MTITIYTYIFSLFFILHNGIETVLEILQINYLKNRGDKVPSHLEGKVDLDTIRKSALYNIEKLKFGLFMRFIDTAILIFSITFAFNFIDSWVRSFGLNSILTGVLFIVVLSAASLIISLPSSIYHTFVIEQKWGFNRQTGLSFTGDLIKETLIGAVIILPLLALILKIMDSTPYWWILAWGVISIFQIVMMWLYPAVIMPMFNKFEKIEGELENEAQKLSDKTMFPLKAVYKMDGSKRSAHSNAFITGFGNSKRIVLFDTLIEKLETSQLMAVLAHELGHYKLGHIKKRLIITTILGVAVFALFGLSSLQTDLYKGLGFNETSNWAALIVFNLFFGEIAFPAGFISRYFSRKDEYAADRFAVLTVKNGYDLKDSLIALGTQNMSSPGSHKWFRGWYNSHPSLRERIKAIKLIEENENFNPKADSDKRNDVEQT